MHGHAMQENGYLHCVIICGVFFKAGYDEYEDENEEEEEDDYEEYDVDRTQPSETTKRRPEGEKTRNWNSDDVGGSSLNLFG